MSDGQQRRRRTPRRERRAQPRAAPNVAQALGRVVGRAGAEAHPDRRPRRARPRLHPRDAARPVAARELLLPRRRARPATTSRAEGPVLLVGNHSGGNMTPGHDRLHARVQPPTSGSSGASTSSPTTSCSRCRASASLRKYGTVARRHENAAQGARDRRRAARLPGRRLRGAPPELGLGEGRLQRPQGLHPAGARQGRADRPGGVDRRPGDGAVPLARRAARASCCGSTGCSASRCCRSRSRCPGA